MILIYKDEVESTQDFLKNNYKNFPDQTFIYAGYQKSGKGQFDRKWESKKNENLLCSFLIKKSFNIENIQYSVSAMIIDFLSEFKIKTDFKKPNDILVQGKKICGILVEKIFFESEVVATIIGIGLNINQTQFKNKDATSLIKIKKDNYDIDKFAKVIAKKLENLKLY